MRHGRKLVVGLALSVTLLAGAQARINTPREGGASGPYRAITDRNIFGLVHIDTSVVATPATPPPNVKLVGLFDISGHPQVVLAILESGPGKAPVNQILEVGQRQQGVELLAVDVAGKTARIQVGDNETPVTIKLEEPKPVTTGAVVGTLPAAPGLGGRPPGYPPARPGFVTTPSGFDNNPAYKNSVPGAFNPAANVEPNAAAGGEGGSLPNRQVRADAQMSAEQQMYNMEIQRAAALEAGSPIANLLPITPYTPPAALQQMNGLTPGLQPQPQGGNLLPSTPLTPQQSVLGQKTTGTYLVPPR